MRARHRVHLRDDWSRAKDSKNWTSEVDWQEALRRDPILAAGSTTRIMSTEAVVKKAAGRDAPLIQARTDLDGGGVGPL